MDEAELLEVAVEAAQAGGQVALGWQARLAELVVEEKTGPADLVSRADREAEAAVLAVLQRARPDDAVLGEESGTRAGTSDVQWVVDPVDGTTNFLYGRADWAVSVAAVSGRTALAGVVLEPVTGRATTAARGGGTWCEGTRCRVSDVALPAAVVDLGLGRPPTRSRAGALFDALVPRARDVRRGGSAAIALASVATGRVDACWSPDLQPWDTAAGVLLVREAGGVVGDLAGLRDDAPRHVLAGGARVVEQLRPLLREVYAGTAAGA